MTSGIDLVLDQQSMGKKNLHLMLCFVTLSMQKRDGRPLTGVSIFFVRVTRSDAPYYILHLASILKINDISYFETSDGHHCCSVVIGIANMHNRIDIL
jgi:hypothetical protein